MGHKDLGEGFFVKHWLLLALQTFSDVDGSYFGTDGSAYNDQQFKRHSLFSLSDTFRALHPLLTISNGERVTDMVSCMVAFMTKPDYYPRGI